MFRGQHHSTELFHFPAETASKAEADASMSDAHAVYLELPPPSCFKRGRINATHGQHSWANATGCAPMTGASICRRKRTAVRMRSGTRIAASSSRRATSSATRRSLQRSIKCCPGACSRRQFILAIRLLRRDCIAAFSLQCRPHCLLACHAVHSNSDVRGPHKVVNYWAAKGQTLSSHSNQLLSAYLHQARLIV